MSSEPMRFNDGAAYERMMGTWSRLAGGIFLEWLKPSVGLRWLDVGCGNGALTNVVAERYAPAELVGIDPSEGQLSFARARPMKTPATFHRADAMDLPFADKAFDIAVMGLVIFFVPEPARAVAEMVRVVGENGTVATYVWDVLGGGFPMDAIQTEMRAIGIEPLLPPSSDASRMPALTALWTEAGLRDLETQEIQVERRFADFEDFWSVSLLGTSLQSSIAAMSADNVKRLKAGVMQRLSTGPDGEVTCQARANAIKGRVELPPAT